MDWPPGQRTDRGKDHHGSFTRVLSVRRAGGRVGLRFLHVDIAGTWKGTVSDSQLGTGTVTATINQSNAVVTGTWAATYTNAANNNNGSLSGTVDGSNVSILLKPSAVNSCGIQLSATSDGKTMSGNYSTVQCTETVTGQISVTRQ
jgi:hypothetical protein